MAMFGFIACDKHECNDYDHSKDLVGTWTCLEAGYAEALVIKADGSALSTGVEDGEYWENVAGNIVVKNGIATMTFEDGDNFEGHIDVIAGMAFSIYNEDGERMTYNYCANDLADEVVGMWVCNDAKDDNMRIHSFDKNGTAVFTGWSEQLGEFSILDNANYKVVGDLIFQGFSNDENSSSKYIVARLVYNPDATTYGNIMTFKHYLFDGIESAQHWLRISQSLDLAGKKYDYIKTFVTNVDGLDKDINFMGFEFNFAKMDGVKLDKMLKTLLFNVEFPDANTIKYSCHYNNEPMSLDAPIVVDGNKMTVKMSSKDAAYKDVDLYTFQDADCSQMHMYMPTYAFVNFFGNMQATMMSQMGDLDLTDATAVKAVFDSIDEAVKTINVSFVMEKAAK